MCFGKGLVASLNQENFPIFDHMQYPNLRTGFWVRNKGNFTVSHSGKLYPHQ